MLATAAASGIRSRGLCRTRALVRNRHSLATFVTSAADHQKKVIETLVDGINQAAHREVPWFLEHMPQAYFRQVAPARRQAHMRAITALSSQGISVPEIQLRDTHGKGFTFISPDLSSRVHNLNHVVERQLNTLPAHLVLQRVLLFQSADGRLGINVFDTDEETGRGGSKKWMFGSPMAEPETLETETAAVGNIKEYMRRMEADDGFAFSESKRSADDLLGEHYGSLQPDAAGARKPLGVDDFLQCCPSTYVIGHGGTPQLFYKQMQMYRLVAGGDDMACTLERYAGRAKDGKDNALLTLAIPQSTARKAIHRAILLLNLHGMELQRAQVDTILDGDDRDVTMLRCVIRPLDGELTPSDATALVNDAARLKWVSDWSFSLANSSGGALSLVEAEVALGLADLSLSVLDHPLLTRKHVRESLHTHDVQQIAAQLARHFLARFDPAPANQMGEADFQDALDHASKAIEAGALSDEPSKQLLRAMASAARHTLRTNVHVDGRWALSMRLDPRFFEPVLPDVGAGFSNLPFGTFFVAGRHFNGYHNRFRDIARGGLRVVLPPSEEAHSAESRRHYMECFGLSWAQQLKNKDIPEGGSKAVCLVTPQPAEDRVELMHGCVKRMADAMLDLLVAPTAHRIVTRTADGTASPLGEELIYLGPDENITPTDLDWIVERAALRGYAMPSAFMSSKPRAGINHKEYGVTSEGVAVFLREALKSIDIEPTERPWTIKLTGGPDGDVAGNMLKILDRDYGANVRVVGLADGTGCAEDPDGLPMDDLLRLFREGLPIASLDTSKLGKGGVLTLADTPEGVAARNTMHNRVVADAFVPAGGRPATMNGSNWRDFLLPDGTPSARVIVEGANLFLTPEARLRLFETVGLPVVKDSSANKCGVICSSMEIRASMCVSDDAFVALKAQYVEEVLARLREMAHLEASLLFAEARRDAATPLPAISERISFAILRVADALSTVMDSYAKTNRLWPLVSSQLPPALAHSEHADQLPERLPWEYQKSTIVKSLASRLVYREGLAFVEGMNDSRLPAFALAYLEQENHIRGLADEVAASGQKFAPEVQALLLQGGVRVAAEVAANQAAAGLVNGVVHGAK